MRHYRKSDRSQSLAVLVAVNVRVTTMYQRTAPSQSDVSVNTLLMIILRWYHISVQKDVHVKNSEVLTLVAVENQLMLTRLVKCAIVFNLGSQMSKQTFSHPSLPLAPFSEVLRGNETSLKFARIFCRQFCFGSCKFLLIKEGTAHILYSLINAVKLSKLYLIVRFRF